MYKRSACLGACLVLFFMLPGLSGCSRQNSLRTEPRNTTVAWQDYSEARIAGRNENKTLLLYFTSSRDEFQGRMRRGTFSDPKVLAYLQKHYVCAWIDPADFPTLTRRYQVTSVPEYWFVGPDGKSLTSVGGLIQPEMFLSLLKFIKSGDYDTISFTKWREKQHFSED